MNEQNIFQRLPGIPPILHNFYKSLPEDLRELQPNLSIDYYKYLSYIHDYIAKIYGSEKSNWEMILKNYHSNSPSNKRINSIDDIPELSIEQIEKMLSEQDKTCNEMNNCITLYNSSAKKSNEKELKEVILEVADILGVSPTSKNGFFEHLFDRQYSSKQEYEKIYCNYMANLTTVYLFENLLCQLLTNHFVFTFPYIGSTITQQRNKYFYRGENAYFGSSRPGIYRQPTTMSPQDTELITKLKYNEAGLFLDNFDAIRLWNKCDINYMALWQHYGLKTNLIDITSDLKTALFFACCKYENGKWRPLASNDFEEADSRENVFNNGGDSRFGIVYRAKSELNDMEYYIHKDKIENLIVPIGYQPFMRCSSQHGYTMFITSANYNLYSDNRFEKFKFRLTEQFCQKIFNMMEQGQKVYPNNDIPNIDKYFNIINPSHIFTEQAVQLTIDGTAKTLETIRPHLKKLGYSIKRKSDFIITQKHINKINRLYGLDNALSHAPKISIMSPFITIS